LTGLPKPLVILTADKDAQFAIQELIRRPAALGIRPNDFDCFPHPGHDSGLYKRGHEFLRAFLKWDYALVVFDREGCGHDDKPRELLESAVENRLAANGWENRCRAVVMDPELESWVWDRSCQVNRLFDWPQGANGLRSWMTERAFVQEESFKPARPKEVFDAALFHRRIKHSSGLFQTLAQSFKFDGCRDEAFQRFVSTLQGWFPPSPPATLE
jgi:hypothetical protein